VARQRFAAPLGFPVKDSHGLDGALPANLSNDPYESYRIFQGRIVDQYESMARPEGFVVVDGTADIEEQQKHVRQKMMELLPQQVRKSISSGALDH
jgi:dTMP kinase